METPYELLIKYCRKQASLALAESQQIETWLAEDDHHSLFLDLKKEWIHINDISIVIPDKHSVWQKIQTKINEQKSKTKHLKIFRWAAAASVILIIVTATLFYIHSLSGKHNAVEQYTTISTTTNEKKEILMADGTKIWLNSNSSLSYNNQYNTNEREVKASGELFFDVTPSGKKFIVNTNKIKIEVLGTSFNVKAVENENIEISLKKGKVAVFNTTNNKQLFVMQPSQHATINEQNLSHILETEETYSSDIWTEKKLNMYNEPLNSILSKLEIWYNIEISSAGLDLDKRYTFHLEKESLEEFLEIFSAVTPIRYRIEGKNVNIEAQHAN